MCMQQLLLLIFGVITVKVLGQMEMYVCVPPGYCDNNDDFSNPGIDPRIVTPYNQECLDGTIPCYTQGPESKCGKRFIAQTSVSDGIADPGTYPWQAFLRNSTHTFAGSGVLLDNYHVLTAAHKVDKEVPEKLTVIMGVHNPVDLTNAQTRMVSSITLHENYDASTLFNDIAILRLAEPISLSQKNINTACLPESEASYVGNECMVSGWGQTSFSRNDAPTNPMKQVNVNITSYEACKTSFSKPNLLGTTVDTYLDPAGEICAGGEPMRDACSQDGGSPLVCPSNDRFYVAGLVIWGKNCGQPGVFGVYVSVPSYRSWIEATIVNEN